MLATSLLYLHKWITFYISLLYQLLIITFQQQDITYTYLLHTQDTLDSGVPNVLSCVYKHVTCIVYEFFYGYCGVVVYRPPIYIIIALPYLV